MEGKTLASLIASFFFLLLPLTPPSSSPSLSPPLLLLLSSSQIATATSLSRKRKRKCRREGLLQEVVPTTNPDPYKHTFNMSSSTFSFLCGLLDPLLDTHDPYPFPSSTRLAIALSRLSSGLPYPSISLRFSLPLPFVLFITRHVTRVLTTNFRFFLSPLPSPSPPLSPLFPSSVAALARTHHSQILADSSFRILSVFATTLLPSRTDASLLKRSSLFTNRPMLTSPREFFVGDGDYPLLPWLMVPYPDPPAGSDELAFNEAHREMCRPVRRAAASLRKWGVMERLDEEDKKMAAACVGTCAILHNVLLMREDYSALAPEEEKEVGWEVKGGLDLEEWGLDEEAVALRNMLAKRAGALRNSGQLGSS